MIAMRAPERDDEPIQTWRAWWTMPLLITAGIIGPNGWWIIGDADPAAIAEAPGLFYAVLALTLISLSILAGGAVITALWASEKIGENLR